MKKKLMTFVAGICTLALLGGCAGVGGAISNRNIKIKQYKGLEVEKVEMPVTDEDVEMSIQSDLETLATKTDVTGRPAQLGDIAIIDFVGKKDGVAFDGGSSTDYELELGSGQFIDGFEDGVVGKNIGEEFNLDLKFPDDYGNTDLAGQAVVFTVTLKGLQQKNVPELTVDILEQLGTKATTIEEYKAQIRADLEVSNKATAESSLVASVWEALVEQCKVKKFPEDMLDNYIKNLEEQYSYYAQMSGKTVDDLFKASYGVGVEEFARIMVTQELAMDLIAKKEGLTISNKEFEEGAKELASQYGYENTEDFLKEYSEDGIRKVLLQEKVGKFLVDNAVQVEPKEDKEK